MHLLELTLPSPEENLALDEALLLGAQCAGGPAEVLRLWEPTSAIVVLGRSSKVSVEVDLNACRRDNVPVLRRSSGGAAIVAAPGCLMYAVVLSYDQRPWLRAINEAHQFVLEQLAHALRGHVADVERAGTSDLATRGRKISGNSLRCRRRHMLYHGTVLFDMQIELIERYLRMPPRQPDYRAARPHGDFCANAPIGPTTLRQAIIDSFQAIDPMTDWPSDLTADLAENKYRDAAWSLRHP